MTTNRQAGHRIFLLAPILGAVLALTGCVADGGGSSSGTGQNFNRSGYSSGSAQPRRATYRCGNAGTILVESTGNAVHVTDTEGATYDLPASPPTQRNRFGEGTIALVIEDGEALWMKAGREPLTCRS